MNGDEEVTRTIRFDPKTELAELDKVFNVILDEWENEELANDQDIADAIKHFRRVCDYNIPHGEKIHGMTMVASFRHLVADLSDDELFRVRVMGCCMEIFAAWILVADDIMDHSPIRRGRPCWYKTNGIGVLAINDSCYLQTLFFKILRKYFRSQPYYYNVVELFQELVMMTVVGQGLDLLTANGEDVDFSTFSMERYDTVTRWKTSFTVFYFPVAVAMHMAGMENVDEHAKAKQVLIEMGHFFQVQNDYLDCFGDPASTGKIGTDIEDNKCGWLITKALLLCTNEQKATLEENYAKKDPESVKKVKQIFIDLDLQKLYKDYEKTTYQGLMSKIDALSTPELPREMFLFHMQAIFKLELWHLHC